MNFGSFFSSKTTAEGSPEPTPASGEGGIGSLLGAAASVLPQVGTHNSASSEPVNVAEKADNNGSDYGSDSSVNTVEKPFAKQAAKKKRAKVAESDSDSDLDDLHGTPKGRHEAVAKKREVMPPKKKKCEASPKKTSAKSPPVASAKSPPVATAQSKKASLVSPATPVH